MSEPRDDEQTHGIDDDQLPDDLTPGDDNPLAEGLDDGESPGDLLEDGKPADESDASEESQESERSGD